MLIVRPAEQQRLEPPVLLTEPETLSRHSLGAPAISLPTTWWNETQDIPPIALTVLQNAIAFGGRIHSRVDQYHFDGQLVLTEDGGLVPASFGVMDGEPTVSGSLLKVSEINDAYRFIGGISVEKIPGEGLLLGNLHRHFGHFLLEGLTRAWACKTFGDDMRLFVYEDVIPPFAYDLLALLGIRHDRLFCLPRAARIERLYIPDTAMRTHRWCTPLQGATWAAIARNVGVQGPPARKVFLSRSGVDSRPLENGSEIENLFAQAGFEIVSSQHLPIKEQVRTASQAKVLAGTVGSQMYLAAFQQPGSKTIILAPQNFCLKDDLLIARAMDHDLHIGFGSPIDFRKRKQDRRWNCHLEWVKNAIATIAA